MIERIGNQYRGEEAESGSVFYQITQDFVNNDRDYLQASDMELYLTDLSSTRSTYDFGGITTLSERFDSDDPLSLYRLSILPWKEKGTKSTVFEVAENATGSVQNFTLWARRKNGRHPFDGTCFFFVLIREYAVRIQ